MIAPKKKRKLNEPLKAPLSAVAARRAALEAKAQAANSQKEEVDLKSSQIYQGSSSTPEGSGITITHTSKEDVATNIGAYGTAMKSLDGEEDTLSSSESRAGSSEPPLLRSSIALSTFKPNKGNVKEVDTDTILLLLAPGERLVIMGQYKILVRKGQITILGTTVPASKKTYTVYAPSSHSLPIIRCLGTDVNHAEIFLSRVKNGLESLQSLSTLFANMWSDTGGSLGQKFQSLLRESSDSTYEILFSSEDKTQKALLQPLVSPPEWNALLSKLSVSESRKAPITMICGPKSSGKSTFARLLTNRLLSTEVTSGSKIPGIALLDLDPGQPEYSIPGHLALVHLQEPNFGPPFAHPIPGNKSRIIRSHAIAALSPAMDPNLYLACASDLFARYRNFLSSFPNCPLIINTPGWVLGTGLEILVELITKTRPTEVVYMSNEGPREVVESLKAAAKPRPLYTLPSQTSEYTTRTAAHLRTMQYMSYFHQTPNPQGPITWNSLPLSSVRPWEIRYSGKNSGILGIICYGEQPPANLLGETINGSLVSIVAIDDLGAIPGWSSSEEKPATSKSVETIDTNFISLNNEPKIYAFDSDQIHPSTITRPLIIQTPLENLPYFNPLNAISLDPTHSHTIGLALIRGIDTLRHRLQILTPIPPSTISELNMQGKHIVLVSGKLDTPGWAYTEELHQRSVFEKRRRKRVQEGDEGDEDEADIFEGSKDLDNPFTEAPWVERLEGSQGRGVGARVWRVRRDLGRMADD